VIVRESFHVELQPRTLAHVEKALNELGARLADEFEDPVVLKEIVELEIEIRSRLQHIAAGDLQT
jgi:hypothetical protein